MSVTAIALKYASLTSQRPYGHFLKVTDSTLCKENDKSSPFNSTYYIVLYPQNGESIVTIDSVTSLHPVHTAARPSIITPNSARESEERSLCPGLWLNIFCTVKAKFHYTGPTADPRGLFRETPAADPGLRQSPRTLVGSGRARVVEFSYYEATDTSSADRQRRRAGPSATADTCYRSRASGVGWGGVN